MSTSDRAIGIAVTSCRLGHDYEVRGTFPKAIASLALFTCFAAFLADAAGAATLCEQLAVVRRAASGGFTEIRGAPKKDGEWAAKVTLAGFETCKIATLPDKSLIYHCQEKAEPDLAQAKKRVSALGTSVKACLGPDADDMVTDMGEAGQMVNLFSNDGLPPVGLNTLMGFDLEGMKAGTPPRTVWRPSLQIGLPRAAQL